MSFKNLSLRMKIGEAVAEAISAKPQQGESR